MAMLVGLPRALRDGKSGDHHFVSACQFQAPFGLDEHESILIYHIIFDRAVFSSVHNRFMQTNEGNAEKKIEGLLLAWSH